MIQPASGVSLYVHIPFCVRKCNYCAFYSIPQADETLKDRYLAALRQQLGSFPEQRPVFSVYFGGGTPSLFGAERITTLLSDIRNRFSLTDDCEITVEINPKTADAACFRLLRSAGVNRISIGMQSAHDEELRALGRIHTFTDVQQCMADARAAGLENISLDLLFALPGQTVERFGQSLQQALALGPTHLSVYSLQLEEGTAFFHRREQLSLPTEEEEEAQYELLCQSARQAGYEHYEISSFARGGFRSRHNLRYWQRGDYLGIGAAAHSFWCDKRFSNTADLQAYLADPLHANNYASAERIDEAEALEEAILLGLRTADGIPAEWVPHERTERMIALELMHRVGAQVALTERGWRVSNAVIGALLVS